MLRITILNDGTVDEQVANYTYLVRTDHTVIVGGRITGHACADGWRVLALEAIAPDLLAACETTRTRIQQALRHGRIVVPLAQIILEEMDAAIAKARGDK